MAAHTSAKEPLYVNIRRVSSAADMFEACKEEAKTADIIIKAAAVADYTPVETADNKIKKSDDTMAITCKRTQDILAYLGAHKPDGQFLCGFSMETEHMLENSEKKLEKKNLDMIVANNLKVKGAGFATDTNVVTLITKEEVKELPLMSKDEVANEILTQILQRRCPENGQ